MRTEKAYLRGGGTLDFVVAPDPPSGTMKEVYFTPDKAQALCFFKDAAAGADPVRVKRLESILGRYNPTVPRDRGGAAQSDVDAGYYADLFCWPTAIIDRPRFGFVTPTYPRNFFFREGPFQGQEKNGSWFTLAKPRSLLERFAPSEVGEWIRYLGLCIQMARAVARMHVAGLAHSDLSPNNVLVDPHGGQAVVIDVDSLVVPGLYAPDVLGTKGYIAPEVLSTIHLTFDDPKRVHPSTRTDEHALAVLIYQYLLGRHPLDGRRICAAHSAEEQDHLAFGPQALYCEHPTDDANRPDAPSYVPASALGPYLEDLFTRTFVDGVQNPSRRPTAPEWVRGLVKTWDLLQPCVNPSCRQKWYVAVPSRPARCTFCSAPAKTPVPVLKLRAESRPGQWSIEGHLTVYHGLRLFAWHVFSRQFPGPGADKTPLAHCLWHQGQWLLVNEGLTSLTSPGGNRVPAGQAVALQPGAQIRLSQESLGRIAEVEYVRT